MNSMSGAGTAPGELLRQIAAFPKRVQNKILDLYYPLTEQALRALNQAKRAGLGNLITNQGYVYNALRLENPFGDRPMEISVREFALKWEMPLSSCYAAFAQLRKMGIIGRMGGLLRIVWIEDPISSRPPLELLSPDIPLPPDESTLLPEGEATAFQEELPPTPENSSPQVATLAQTSARKPKAQSEPTTSAPLNLSSEVIAQLKEVKVDLSRKDILKVLERATIGQISEVIDHMHQHWELIETNYSHGHTTIFIKELNKRLEGGIAERKPKSKGKKTHSQEFLDWYAKAIAEGIVIDRPVQHLPTSSSNEPIVTLANGEQSVWTLARHSVGNQTAEPSSQENTASFRETLAKLNLLHKFKPQRNTE
jgi:hypothetical protein